MKSFDKDRNSLEYKIYDLITRRFIASCWKDAECFEKKVLIEVNGEFFNKKGLEITKKNFLEIYEKFYYIKGEKLP